MEQNLGTVVKLKNLANLYLIIGYNNNEEEKSYTGSLYPQGYTATTVIQFNEDDIEEILYSGYKRGE